MVGTKHRHILGPGREGQDLVTRPFTRHLEVDPQARAASSTLIPTFSTGVTRK